MASLKVVGQHKGLVTLDLDTATVLDLKKAVSRGSGLPVAGLKLLAGGKHLKDDTCSLTECGLAPGKTIMVLRQDLSETMEAEESLTRRTEEAVQAASRLSARAARDIGDGGRGHAWGQWGRSDAGRRRDGGDGREGRRPGGGGVNDDTPQIELTNQDGEAMAIPREDSAALMEGMMLHRQGLACLAQTQMRRTRTSTETTQMSAAASAGQAPAGAASATAPDSIRSRKKTRRRPISPTHQRPGAVGTFTNTGRDASAIGDGTFEATGSEGSRGGDISDRGGNEAGKMVQDEAEEEQGTQAGGREERNAMKSRACEEKEVDVQYAEEQDKGKGPLRGPGEEVDGMDVDSVAADKGDGAPVPLTSKGGGHKHLGPALSDSDKLIARREALALLMRADEAFRRCDPKYLEAVDNYAYLCLDIVWLLFLMKDMKNLDLASRMLAAVEKGFRKAHGPGLQRLTALKGEYCAEKLLYVRLHLLQGVVAFLQGDSGKASALLIRASAEAKSLKPNPALATQLMQQWHALKFEVLQPTVALRALRAGRNNLDAAWQYLENLRQRKDTVRKERKRRMEQRRASRHGLTADKKAFVDAALVDQLAQGGFPRGKAIRALRQHNNDVGAALASLTSAAAGGGPAGGGGNSNSGNGNEALAVLHSLGVPPDAAREVLSRTGNLCEALRELGISAPDGESGGGGATSESGGGAEAGERSESGEESDGEGEDGPEDHEPTPEEKRLFNELAADRENEDDESYLDVTLEDEADAADMYLLLCQGNIPIAFDLDKVRAEVAAATVTKNNDGAKR